MADINYLFGVIKAGKVIKRYFGHSLAMIKAIKKKYKGCDVETFDVSEYGMKFEETPIFIADGKWSYEVRCEETGEVWSNVVECAESIGVPRQTLYKAIERGNALRIDGRHYVKDK